MCNRLLVLPALLTRLSLVEMRDTRKGCQTCLYAASCIASFTPIHVFLRCSNHRQISHFSSTSNNDPSEGGSAQQSGYGDSQIACRLNQFKLLCIHSPHPFRTLSFRRSFHPESEQKRFPGLTGSRHRIFFSKTNLGLRNKSSHVSWNGCSGDGDGHQARGDLVRQLHDGVGEVHHRQGTERRSGTSSDP